MPYRASSGALLPALISSDTSTSRSSHISAARRSISTGKGRSRSNGCRAAICPTGSPVHPICPLSRSPRPRTMPTDVHLSVKNPLDEGDPPRTARKGCALHRLASAPHRKFDRAARPCRTRGRTLPIDPATIRTQASRRSRSGPNSARRGPCRGNGQGSHHDWWPSRRDYHPRWSGNRRRRNARRSGDARPPQPATSVCRN